MIFIGDTLILKFLNSALRWLNLFIWLCKNRGHKTFGTNEIKYAIDLYICLKKQNVEALEAARNSIGSIFKKLQPKVSPFKIKRVGPKFDSGYYIADMRKVDMVVSGGAGKNIDFEHKLAKMDSEVHICDPTVKTLPRMHPRIKHHKIFLGSDERKIPTISLKHFEELIGLQEHNVNLLKLDIEGSELNLLGKRRINLMHYDQIVIEIHDLHKLVCSDYREKFLQTFNNLLKFHYVICFNSNNNGLILNFGQYFVPEIFELTLLNKKYFKSKNLKNENLQLSSNNNKDRLSLPNIFSINDFN